jgi:hypothetical protein
MLRSTPNTEVALVAIEPRKGVPSAIELGGIQACASDGNRRWGRLPPRRPSGGEHLGRGRVPALGAQRTSMRCEERSPADLDRAPFPLVGVVHGLHRSNDFFNGF